MALGSPTEFESILRGKWDTTIVHNSFVADSGEMVAVVPLSFADWKHVYNLSDDVATGVKMMTAKKKKTMTTA